MHPSAATDTIASSLKLALEEKTAAAKEKYAAFDDERKRLLEKGTDLAKDVEALKRLQDLHADYRSVEEEAVDLRGRLDRELLGGKAEGIPTAAGHSLGTEFLQKVGAGVVGFKALEGTSGGTMVKPFYDPQIRELPQRQLFVRSVIPVRQAEGDKVWYLRQSVATQNAAAVAAGAVKPTSVYTVERIEETVRTIAHVTEALDRGLLSDFDELVDFLDNQLRLGVLLAEENQILNGNGTAPNLRGILNTSGVQSQARGTDPHVEAIHKAINLCRLSFFEPDAVVLHPSDWQTIRLAKNANGDYLTASVIEEAPPRLYGKQVITSPVIAQGTGLVGAFEQAAVVWDREEARVTFTESGLGDGAGTELFTRNQVRFRGEERIAFGVTRPAAFCQVTGL